MQVVFFEQMDEYLEY